MAMQSLDGWLRIANNDTHATQGALRAALTGEDFDLTKGFGVIAAELTDNRAGLRTALLGYNNVTRGKVNGLFSAADEWTRAAQRMFLCIFFVYYFSHQLATSSKNYFFFIL